MTNTDEETTTMIDTQKYDSYSVGAYTVRGNEIGGEYGSLAHAQERFNALKDDATRIASIVLYGWQDDGTCDQLDSWSL